MATPSPIDIKSAARKLPIKRKSPSELIHITNPNPAIVSVSDSSARPSSNNGYHEDDPDAEYDEEEPEDDGTDAKQPPFKFHRIWSESDEIRFLQGLLGCWSQGLLFPRDLNIFYDRFSESMSQPYTRSQLSEKLRRLRKKYRTMAGRLARGQSSSRLSQHDRDLLHLSTRLWDPVHASTSPFSAPDAVSAGSSGNKRRRPIPSAPVLKASASSSPQLAATEIAPYIPPNPPQDLEGNALPEGTDAAVSHEEEPKEEPTFPPAGSSAEMKMGPKNPAVNWILDALDDALKEVRSVIASQGAISSDDSLRKGVENKDLLKRWQEQRLAELDLIAQRWRLFTE